MRCRVLAKCDSLCRLEQLGGGLVRCMILWHMILKMVEAGGRTFAMYSWLSSGSSIPLCSWAQDLAMLGSPP